MDEARAARWCRERCQAKCCSLRLPDEGEIFCPNLTAEKACGVYPKRYAEGMPDLVVVGYWRSRKYRELDGTPATRPFFCGRITEILSRKALPPEVEEQCCWAHPELLDTMEDR